MQLPFGNPTNITGSKAAALTRTGLNNFWSEASEVPIPEWEKSIDLFAVVMMVKHSISSSRHTRPSFENRVEALMGSPIKTKPSRKVVNFLFLSFVQAAVGNFLDKFLTIPKTIVSLTEL